MPPSDFSGRGGRCGVHSLPSLNSGLPLVSSALSAATVADTPSEASEASSSPPSPPPGGGRSTDEVRREGVTAPADRLAVLLDPVSPRPGRLPPSDPPPPGEG